MVIAVTKISRVMLLKIISIYCQNTNGKLPLKSVLLNLTKSRGRQPTVRKSKAQEYR